MPDSPNVVLCLCDQLRSFAVGCYGNDQVQTPNIDRLAERGARFDTTVTPNPRCTPARSATLSGQYSRTCAGMLGNVHRNPPNPERNRLLDPTLPELLQQSGYHTELIGKWHVGPTPRLVGFDEAVFPKVAHRHYGQTYYDEQGNSFVVDEFAPEWELERVREFFADQRGEDDPFFLFYNIPIPHQPIGSGHLPERYLDMYDPDEVPLRPNAVEDGDPTHDRWWFNVYTSADFFWRDLEDEEQDPEDIVPEDFDLRDLTALYYGATSCVDDLVGGMLSSLEANGLDDDTIVVFASDHGDNLGSHGMFNKGKLIEEAYRVPLVVDDPREGAVENETDVVSLVDVAPTLLDLAGVRIPDHVQGRSLAPSVRGNGPLGRDRAFIETGSAIGVRSLTHLYGIAYDEESREVGDGDHRVYDLQADPFQLDNLAGTDEQEDVARQLREALLAWDDSTPWLDAPEPERDIG